MFLFDIADGNYIEVVAYQRDYDLPEMRVQVSSMCLDSSLHVSYDPYRKSAHVDEHSARIYKSDKYNAVVFSRHREMPCIFAVPRVNFNDPVLAREKRPANSGYSTMTLAEDEQQKKLYHRGKMDELHEKVKEQYAEGKITHETRQIFLKMILPNRHD